MNGPYILTVGENADLDRLLGALAGEGLWARLLEAHSEGAPRLVEIDSRSRAVEIGTLRSMPGVAHVAARKSEHPLVDEQAGRAIAVGALRIGPGAPPVLMAGPCAVESARQISELAEAVASNGGHLLRGSAYKPRSSPYSFQGHGEVALAWLRAAADRNGLGVITEVLATEDAARVAEVSDLMQIGSRNMQNFSLLRAVGRLHRPVLLKRGLAATVEDWLLSAEYCLREGAPGVIFCERGLRGFDPSTRNLLDLGAVALLAHAYHLPIVVDPSHAVGRRDLVAPLSRAALAAGAHGLIVEVHADPASARSDGPQALAPEALGALMSEGR
jgi:3-deoxy-7-phosphoheptulonate synthase